MPEMPLEYTEFLRSKISVIQHAGFETNPCELHPENKPHQDDAVTWACSLGRALIAMSFGMGKTRIQAQIAELIIRRAGKPFLVICPLSVKQQFAEEDGPAMGQTWTYVRNDAEAFAAVAAGHLYLLTNYERVRDGNITPAFIGQLAGVSLDEGSILRNLGSETSEVFKRVFKAIPFRFVATATPSPNDYKELIYYAEFLGVMDHGQALTRWFKRDSNHAGHLTLMPSQEEEFWLWVASWALFVSKPSDLAHPDDGYVLPALNIHWHRVSVDHTRAWSQTDNRGQRRLILDASAGVSEASAEKRATLADRLAKMLEIIEADPEKHWILWHHLEAERHAIQQVIPEAVAVFGTQDLEEREKRIIDFSHGRYRILSTKPEVAGSGCNFQKHCHSAVFLGVDYKFQDFIQAIHRLYRFLQTQDVDIHIIYAESEDQVVDVLKRKWRQHDKLVERMREIVKRFGLTEAAIQRGLSRKIGVNRLITKGKLFTAVNNDCVTEMGNLPDEFCGLIHTSIPFGNHYEYTTNYEDFGHNPTDGAFWAQMDFLIPELLRVLKPGRLAAIHVKDRQLYGHQTHSGFMETAPFSDECVMAFRKHGWLYQGRRTIVTDVVRENASTYRLGYTEMTHDASKMSSGLPEYLLLFRKAPTSSENARADEPVTKHKTDYSRARWQLDAHSFWRSNGNRLLLPDEAYDYEAHVGRLEDKERSGNLPSGFFYEPPVSPSPWVWDDVVYMRSLNSEQSRGQEEAHICPLPFDIVERTIRLYSNEGELVLDPFFGIGTVGYMAIKLGRQAHGIELNRDYYEAAVRYCKQIEAEVTAPTLFDYLKTVAPQAAD